MNKLMTSSSSSGSELLPPFVRLAAGEDRLAGVMHHRDKKKCDVVGDFGVGGGGSGGVSSSLYALTHDVIGFGGCGGNTSMALSTAVAAAGGVSSSVAPPRGLSLSDNTGCISYVACCTYVKLVCLHRKSQMILFRHIRHIPRNVYTRQNEICKKL